MKSNKNIKNFNDLKSWPFIEAKKIIDLYGGLENFKKPNKEFIVFETGYGPSGLPHIGTFGEVVRTLMVQNAFEQLTGCNSKVITFSDDMDGLRKVPDNVPNKNMLSKYLDMPLTSIPDPFGKFESFGDHNNNKLKSFLDKFNFSYDFKSSTELYKKGFFDETIKLVMQNYESILSIILPTLREGRRETYSPFLPICEKTNKVLQIKIEQYNINNYSIVYKDPQNNKLIEKSILSGGCKLQWKVDWAMRWIALEVDYEMCGKDLTDSVKLGSMICNKLRKKPPINLIYEMFLDQNGEKISKSKGNGISIDEWLKYSTPESLSLFMFQRPKSAKKLHFDVIPKCNDEYLNFNKNFHEDQTYKKMDNPVWHIHFGKPPVINSPITFNTLMNLVSVCNSIEPKIIWSFINEYNPKLIPFKNDYINNQINYAIEYYKDFILPKKNYKLLDEKNKKIFIDLKNTLQTLKTNTKPEDIQTSIYDIGKKYDFKNLRHYFQLIYNVLLGQDEGPRLGSFIALYGIKRTIILIDKALNKEDLSNQA